MKTHRQGRTVATSVAIRDTAARRLLATLRRICRQLCRIQPDGAARQACREVERQLRGLEQMRQAKRRRK